MEDKRLEATARLLEVMNTLRRECPWDREQTFDSLRSNTIEETYELADAITDHNMEGIKEELGDLLLHVVFYSKLGEEAGSLRLCGEVADALCDKLIYRHPHVYGDIHANTPDAGQGELGSPETPQERTARAARWAAYPARFRRMVKAFRVGEKAAATGFDWQRREDVWDKVKEETAEVEAEMRSEAPGSRANLEAEFGDLFFALVNACAALRHRPRIGAGTYEQEVHPPLQLHGGKGCRRRIYAPRASARKDGGATGRRPNTKRHLTACVRTNAKSPPRRGFRGGSAPENTALP